MIRKMEKGKLLIRSTTNDAYNEIVEDWREQRGPIELAVSVATGATGTVNNVVSVTSTHTGLTLDKRPKPQDKIELNGIIYKVDHVIASTRFIQLMLTQEKAI